MKTSVDLFHFAPLARIFLLFLLLGSSMAMGCRSFDYTDSDLERERQLMKKGSDGGIYQPGQF